MQEELNAIWQQTRNTVLFVTHDIDEAIYLADRVIVFTARPGRIKDEIDIKLERPRRIDVKKSAAYMAYRNRVWDSLRDEVLKAREEFQ
jgi:NitT/TauT family transport system ATP-binding protein